MEKNTDTGEKQMIYVVAFVITGIPGAVPVEIARFDSIDEAVLRQEIETGYGGLMDNEEIRIIPTMTF